jgi:hypothetical protein
VVLTEGAFRNFWEKTDKGNGNERQRFIAVQALIREANLAAPERPRIGNQIIEQFADGGWHATSTIATALGTDDDHVRSTLTMMRGRRKTYGANCETKKTAKGEMHRIFYAERTINTSELKTKLLPIIMGLKEQGSKRIEAVSVGTVADLAVKLERLMTEWVEGGTPSNRRPDRKATKITGRRGLENE